MLYINFFSFSKIRNIWNALPQRLPLSKTAKVGIGVLVSGAAIFFGVSTWKSVAERWRARLELEAWIKDLDSLGSSQEERANLREHILKNLVWAQEQMQGMPPQDQRDEIVSQAKQLFTSKTPLLIRVGLIKELASFSREERSACVERLLQSEESRAELHAYLKLDPKLGTGAKGLIPRIIDAFKVPKETFESLKLPVHNLASSFPEPSYIACECLIPILAGVPQEELESLIEGAKQILKGSSRRALEYYPVIACLVNLPKKERERSIECAKKIFPSPSNGFQANLIEALSAIHTKGLKDHPFNELIADIEQLSEQLTNQHTYNHRISILKIIHILGDISTNEERSVFIALTTALAAKIREERFDTCYFHRISGCMIRIPLAERQERQQRALLQLERDRAELVDRGQILDRICELLETPLDAPFAPLQHDMQALAKAGHRTMNVHAGARDPKTRNALLELQTKQGSFDQQTIDSAVCAFIQYLNTTTEEKDPIKKQNALRALGTGSMRDDDRFDRLLRETKFTIADTDFNGPELIARLWRFSNEYEDPASGANTEKERISARVGMIAALSDSIDDDGIIVCNFGKAQRLVVSVLQGRLARVDVDSIIQEEALLSAVEAINLFFAAKKHREIQTREVLLIAAEQFCQDNPRVLKNEFMKEIEEFCNNSELL